jgi:hypothetical protein
VANQGVWLFRGGKRVGIEVPHILYINVAAYSSYDSSRFPTDLETGDYGGNLVPPLRTMLVLLGADCAPTLSESLPIISTKVFQLYDTLIAQSQEPLVTFLFPKSFCSLIH